MNSLASAKICFAIIGTLAIAGCLVSDDPILTVLNGSATPISSGSYIMCPLDEDSDEDDCDTFEIKHDSTGLYNFVKEGEEPTRMRFRRIGHRGYAAQGNEDDDYIYYYGAGDSNRFLLTMMMCSDLPEKLRSRLIKRDDLGAEGDDFETCTVKSLKGLTSSARAYHRGKVTNEESTGVMEIIPAGDK